VPKYRLCCWTCAYLTCPTPCMKPAAEPAQCSAHSRTFSRALTASGELEMLAKRSEQLLSASGFWSFGKEDVTAAYRLAARLSVTGPFSCHRSEGPRLGCWDRGVLRGTPRCPRHSHQKPQGSHLRALFPSHRTWAGEWEKCGSCAADASGLAVVRNRIWYSMSGMISLIRSVVITLQSWYARTGRPCVSP